MCQVLHDLQNRLPTTSRKAGERCSDYQKKRGGEEEEGRQEKKRGGEAEAGMNEYFPCCLSPCVKLHAHVCLGALVEDRDDPGQ